MLALPLATAAVAQTPAATGVGSQFELTFWQSVESGNDAALYEAYLAQYPNGTFAAVARVKLARLRQLATPASTPAPVAVPVTAPAQIIAPAPAAPAPTAAPAPAPAPVPTLAPTPAPIVTAAAAPPAAKPAPAPAAKQVLSAKAARLAARPAPQLETVPKSDPDSAPYVTAALPPEPEPESSDGDALRRLLGALGDSQRVGSASPAPIVEVADVAQTAAAAPAAAAPAPAAPLALPPAPAAAPGLSPPFAAVATGRIVSVPDAARLSLTSTPATDPHPIAVGPLPPGFALPRRPQLAAIPLLAFPASFCSAEARNAFHDSSYITAVEVAKRNNDATIAYMRQLQDLYDSNQLTGDSNSVNAIAAESQSYSPVAAAAFTAQSTLVSAFGTLMAVPIRPCEAARQP
ncbi:hypothetical protein NSE01_22590 [Novosphingobium sediminis]|uniref:Uncharacterized protein n=2 Tax=Novosphingobium sediminis TaxID=707214 RepID=A0A512ALA0_9SPHN|nr:hypothetical protein NSE01_22590 [Novosphingobium sediminis]